MNHSNLCFTRHIIGSRAQMKKYNNFLEYTYHGWNFCPEMVQNQRYLHFLVNFWSKTFKFLTANLEYVDAGTMRAALMYTFENSNTVVWQYATDPAPLQITRWCATVHAPWF